MSEQAVYADLRIQSILAVVAAKPGGVLLQGTRAGLFSYMAPDAGVACAVGEAGRYGLAGAAGAASAGALELELTGHVLTDYTHGPTSFPVGTTVTLPNTPILPGSVRLVFSDTQRGVINDYGLDKVVRCNEDGLGQLFDNSSQDGPAIGVVDYTSGDVTLNRADTGSGRGMYGSVPCTFYYKSMGPDHLAGRMFRRVPPVAKLHQLSIYAPSAAGTLTGTWELREGAVDGLTRIIARGDLSCTATAPAIIDINRVSIASPGTPSERGARSLVFASLSEATASLVAYLTWESLMLG